MAASSDWIVGLLLLSVVVGGVFLSGGYNPLSNLGGSNLFKGNRVNVCDIDLSVVTPETTKCFADVNKGLPIATSTGGCLAGGAALGATGALLGGPLAPYTGGAGLLLGCLGGAFGGYFGGSEVADYYAAYVKCPTRPHIEKLSCSTRGTTSLSCPSSEGLFALTTVGGKLVVTSPNAAARNIPLIGQKLGGPVKEPFELNKLYGFTSQRVTFCTDDTLIKATLFDANGNVYDEKKSTVQLLGVE